MTLKCVTSMSPEMSRAMYALRNYPKLTEAPRARFIYFLISNEDVVYIGKTMELYARVRDHRKQNKTTRAGKSFDYVRYVECFTYHDHDQVEMAFIRYLLPKYNKCVLGSFGESDRILLKEYGVEA